jgi:SAM-dependent methyltransferase
VSADYDERLRSCPLCGSGDLRGYDHDFRGHRIDRCGGCGVKLMNPQYSDAYLQRFYSTYISMHDQGTDRWKSRPEVRTTGKRRSLRLLASYAGLGKLLMIGCGDGLELGIAKELGWAVEGYDIDPETTAAVAEKFGVPVHCGPIDELTLGEGTFDAVFMDQVIEHPKDPSVYLRICRTLLRSGGLLFLGTPNIGSISNVAKTQLGRIGLRRKRRGNQYASKHHIFYYTPRVLRSLLEKHYGFEVLTVRGSLKPQRKPLTAFFGRWLPVVDSGFLIVARRPANARAVFDDDRERPIEPPTGERNVGG